MFLHQAPKRRAGIQTSLELAEGDAAHAHGRPEVEEVEHGQREDRPETPEPVHLRSGS